MPDKKPAPAPLAALKSAALKVQFPSGFEVCRLRRGASTYRCADGQIAGAHEVILVAKSKFAADSPWYAKVDEPALDCTLNEIAKLCGGKAPTF